MLVVGDNLKSLIKQYSIIENPDSGFDETSISLTLDTKIIKIIPPQEENVITYGEKIPDEWIIEKKIKLDEGLTLEPHEAILGCSNEQVNMPLGYFGFLQTKGSLARLFISIHCCDSQIEPGFCGKITYEICNNSNLRIKLLPRQKVADLFIFKTTTRNRPYNGRYNKADKPTVQLPEK